MSASRPRWIDAVRDCCAGQPGAQLEHPFGDDVDVFKVGGKVFAVATFDAAPRRVTLKAEPERASALREEHDSVAPGYHMDKRHWITLDLTRRPPGALARELIEDSYDLVRDSLTKAAQRALPPAPG